MSEKSDEIDKTYVYRPFNHDKLLFDFLKPYLEKFYQETIKYVKKIIYKRRHYYYPQILIEPIIYSSFALPIQNF